jgi:ABC-type antimicrobial peptide transport system permease subunit
MKIHRTLRTALNAMRRNPMRAALTTLGIVIGIGAVIAMMEIGGGSSAQLRKTIASMGANVLLVVPGTSTSSGVSQGSGSNVTLTPQDCEAIARDCPSVRAVAPMVRARTQIIYGGRNWVPDQMIGTTAAYLDIRDWAIAEGEAFSDRDVQTSARVCLLGQTVVRELFDGEPALGREIRVNNVPVRVIGVLAAKGANMVGMDQDNVFLAPWTLLKYRIAGSTLASANQSASGGSSSSGTTLGRVYPSDPPVLYPERATDYAKNNPLLVRFANISSLMAAAHGAEQISSAISEISQVLRRQHNLRTGQPDDFDVRDMTEMSNTLSSTTRLMTNLLLCVALISLVVGGVGIMNIMLVSVTERTREIGLRMAVGARRRDILRQFLVEAIVLCLAGGALGILLGRGGSYLVTLALAWPTEISVQAILAAVAVSATIGLIFGYYPAWKASRLDPIEALRYE